MSSARYVRVFRVVALAFVPALLVAAELTLRATEPPQPTLDLPTGWQGDARVVTDHNRDTPLEAYTTPDGEPHIRTTSAMKTSRFMHDVDYAQQRPDGVLRVFCFGGSATLGVPVEATPERTFPGRLQAALQNADVPAEVINLGGASFGSSRVVELMAQAVGHQPSALVVYSGNNEFFEYALALHQRNARQADTVFERRSGLRLVRWLYGLSDALEGAQPAAPEDLEQRQQALVRTAVELELYRDPSTSPQPVGDDGWRRRDAPYRAVMDRYRDNLDAMVELASGVAPLVLVAVPPNLHQAPFQAAHDPALRPSQIASWQRDVAGAQQALDNGDPNGATGMLDSAIAGDPIHAQAHYLRGLAWLEAGDALQASRDLHNALELDMAPGRPLAAQTEAILALANPPAVVVVDPGPSFEAYGLARGGEGHFHDACHLTPGGYDLLARHVAHALEGAGVSEPIEGY